MDVDEAGDPTPTKEWMEAAQRAVDTDGILENGSAKRQKVCNSCNTLTALHLQTLVPAQECTQKERVSQESTRASRTTVRKKEERERAPKRAAPTHLRTPSQIPPESLPWHCRGTAVALPSTMRSSSLRSPREAAQE